ncbi:electron transport complex subunit E [Reinekea marinisedimentorum]|uniref:Ion-translocating oxidoreductase complex subunit E n=1 Tax=Reinekea marinisedimentorum TaxID=230495 RepID=A0A4R3HZN9_9GAMM|nr:electron transport complex subunit E [Reinekea marinisedimentorum]TCS38877.1 electron transport complex protein RnfE [Reinekea marinisedimentorum]
MSEYKSIFADGLWRNNVVLGQSLALCPLLAVTSNATNGLGLGLATLFVMVFANLIASLMKNTVTRAIRIPVNILLIATLVTVTDLLLNAYLHDLHKVLGLFIPLIVTNCAILGRVESFASRNSLVPAMADGLAMGLGFTVVLTGMGAIREILGSGTLFANASLLLGPHFEFLEVTVIPDYRGFLILILPPGGFMVLSFILAAQKKIQAVAKRRAEKQTTTGGEQCA